MNQNIEVINSKLWAVRFSLLQYIREIEYKPDPQFKTSDEEFGRISKEGILILNKDHKAFSLIKEFLPNLMKRSMAYLIGQSKGKIKGNQLRDYVYKITVMLEIQRRKQLEEMG